MIYSYHKRVVETRLAAFYSKINQAIKLSEYDNDGKESWTAVDTNDFWEKYLKNYLKYLRYENKRVGNSNDWRLVYLLDGSAFLIDIYGTWDSEGKQIFKTNGGHFVFCPTLKYCEKGYNQSELGKTQFIFGFWPAGEIAPKWHANKGVEPYLNGWDGNPESLYTSTFAGCSSKSSAFYCTAVIRNNGWKIPSKYPFKVK